MKRKSRIEVRPHAILEGDNVIAVYCDNKLLCTVTGGVDYPGIRIVTKYAIRVEVDPGVISREGLKVYIDERGARNAQDN